MKSKLEYLKQTAINLGESEHTGFKSKLYYLKSIAENTAGGLIQTEQGSVNLSNYIQKSNTNGLVKNDGSIDTNNYIVEQDLDTVEVTITYTDNTSETKELYCKDVV